MYEILSAIILAIVCYVIYKQAKDIETIVQANTEFLTQHATYVKAVGDHSEAVQGVLEDLENKAEKNYYAVTALAAHVEYLEKRVNEIEEKCNAN